MDGPLGQGPNTAPLVVSIQNRKSLAQVVSMCCSLCLLHAKREAIRVTFLAYLPYPLRCDGNHRYIKLARNIGKIKLEIILFFNKLAVLIPKGREQKIWPKKPKIKVLSKAQNSSFCGVWERWLGQPYHHFFFFFSGGWFSKRNLKWSPKLNSEIKMIICCKACWRDLIWQWSFSNIGQQVRSLISMLGPSALLPVNLFRCFDLLG